MGEEESPAVRIAARRVSSVVIVLLAAARTRPRGHVEIDDFHDRLNGFAVTVIAGRFIQVGGSAGRNLHNMPRDDQRVCLVVGKLQLNRFALTFPRDRVCANHTEDAFRQSLTAVAATDLVPAVRIERISHETCTTATVIPVALSNPNAACPVPSSYAFRSGTHT